MPKKPKNPLIPSYRVRHDGWTHARTKTFLATLRHTGCVMDAARVIGMSTTSGYRLYNKDAKFREAWDAALADGRRGLIAVAHERAVVGKETVIYRGGEEYERRISPDSSILALLIKHGDMGGDGGRIGNRTADKVITLEEWDDGIRFDASGAKYEEPSAEDMREALRQKLIIMQGRAMNNGQRHVNINTGEGFTPEVLAAAQRFGGGDAAKLIEDKR